MTRKTRTILIASGLAVAVAGSVAINLSVTSRAPVSDEALQAAQTIVAEQGGGQQAKSADGVPLDAVVDPAAMKAADRTPEFGR